MNLRNRGNDPTKTLGRRIAGQFKVLADRLNTLNLSVFNLAWLAIAEDFNDYIARLRPLPKAESNEIMVLANGPSLKDTIAKIKNGEERWNDKDAFFVNYLAQDDVFKLMKPRHYVLSDPQFFLDGYPNSIKGHELLRHLKDNTEWDMNLYIPYNFRKRESWLEENKHIKVIPFHTVPCVGTKSLRYWMSCKGLANGQYGTVVQNAVYIATHLGFRRIHLYGVDHNFFDDLCLNDDNVLCSRISHFYDTGKQELRPVRIAKDNIKVGDFLAYYSTLFNGYYVLKEYADSCGCEIINHTANSLIDAFKKE